jgi:thiamine transport system substrate-binding protein
MVSKRFIAIVLSASAVMLVAGCSSEAANVGSGPVTGTPVPTSSRPNTVRLLAHDSFVVSDSLIADFESRTGLDLEVVTAGDAGTMVAGAILAAGAPTADVMFGVDNTLLSRTLDAGVFEPYSATDRGSVAPQLLADTGDGTVTPIDYGDVCVNIDDKALAARDLDPPRSLDDLVRPEYRDLLVVEDPGTSSPGLAFLLATIARYGDGWQKYWRQLADNGVHVASSWTDAYMGQFSGGGGGGSRPLVVSYATSPPAEIVYAADPKPTRPSTSVLTECSRERPTRRGPERSSTGCCRRPCRPTCPCPCSCSLPARARRCRPCSRTSRRMSPRPCSWRPTTSRPTSPPGWPTGGR